MWIALSWQQLFQVLCSHTTINPYFLFIIQEKSCFRRGKKIACHQKGQDPLCKLKWFSQDENSFLVQKWLQFAFFIFSSWLFFNRMLYESLRSKFTLLAEGLTWDSWQRQLYIKICAPVFIVFAGKWPHFQERFPGCLALTWGQVFSSYLWNMRQGDVFHFHANIFMI